MTGVTINDVRHQESPSGLRLDLPHSQSQAKTTTMTSGTQSPPLEATGEHECMGISSVNNPDAKIEVVPDCEQRARACSLPTATETRP